MAAFACFTIGPLVRSLERRLAAIVRVTSSDSDWNYEMLYHSFFTMRFVECFVALFVATKGLKFYPVKHCCDLSYYSIGTLEALKLYLAAILSKPIISPDSEEPKFKDVLSH